MGIDIYKTSEDFLNLSVSKEIIYDSLEEYKEIIDNKNIDEKEKDDLIDKLITKHFDIQFNEIIKKIDKQYINDLNYFLMILEDKEKYSEEFIKDEMKKKLSELLCLQKKYINLKAVVKTQGMVIDSNNNKTKKYAEKVELILKNNSFKNKGILNHLIDFVVAFVGVIYNILYFLFYPILYFL